MTPKGHAGTQYPQPLQMSSCTTTVPYSVRTSEPVGHTSRHAALVQCLHTSDDMSQRKPSPRVAPEPSSAGSRWASCGPSGTRCSMKATWRHASAPSPPVLSYDVPRKFSPSSGTPFHSLHATSHALQP